MNSCGEKRTVSKLKGSEKLFCIRHLLSSAKRTAYRYMMPPCAWDATANGTFTDYTVADHNYGGSGLKMLAHICNYQNPNHCGIHCICGTHVGTRPSPILHIRTIFVNCDTAPTLPQHNFCRQDLHHTSLARICHRYHYRHIHAIRHFNNRPCT